MDENTSVLIEKDVNLNKSSKIIQASSSNSKRYDFKEHDRREKSPLKLSSKKRKLQDASAGSPKITKWFIDLSQTLVYEPKNEERIELDNKPSLINNPKTPNKVVDNKYSMPKSSDKKKYNKETCKIKSKIPQSRNQTIRKRIQDNAGGSPKITEYFSKRDKNKAEGKRINYDERSPKLTVTSSSTKSKDKVVPTHNIKENISTVVDESSKNTVKSPTKTINKKKVSESFRKYGVHIPTFSEIVSDMRKFRSYGEKVDKAFNILEEKSKLLEERILPTLQVANTTPLIGCEELSKQEIKAAFLKNKQYCIDIITGKESSERHNLFKTKRNTSELIVNNFSDVFTQIQMKQLTKLCFKHLINYFKSEVDSYCFKVLLPELCLKIFMDTHNMIRDDAEEYLNNRPVGDL